MVEKSGLPFLLAIHAVRHRLPEVLAGLPFLAGNGKYHAGGLFCDFLPVKSHHRIFAVLEDIDGHILVDQLRRPVSGQGQKVSIQIAAPLQILRCQVRVGPGVFVQRSLPQSIILCRDVVPQFIHPVPVLFRYLRHSPLHSLFLCRLQGLQHIQRNRLRTARMLALHRADDVTGGFQWLLRGPRRVLIVKLPAVHEAHGFFVIKGVVNAGVGDLDMEIGGIVYQKQRLIQSLCLFRLAGGGGLRRGPVLATQVPDGSDGDGLFL